MSIGTLYKILVKAHGCMSLKTSFPIWNSYHSKFKSKHNNKDKNSLSVYVSFYFEEKTCRKVHIVKLNLFEGHHDISYQIVISSFIHGNVQKPLLAITCILEVSLKTTPPFEKQHYYFLTRLFLYLFTLTLSQYLLLKCH